MPADRPTGGQLLVALSGAMVTIFREALGKGPENCKAYWAGKDMIVIVLGGGFSVAEQTLFDAGRASDVNKTRMILQQALAERMKAAVENLTGRGVAAVLAASNQHPDLTIELFVLRPLEADGQPT